MWIMRKALSNSQLFDELQHWKNIHLAVLFDGMKKNMTDQICVQVKVGLNFNYWHLNKIFKIYMVKKL